jgi:hypothetical protein
MGFTQYVLLAPLVLAAAACTPDSGAPTRTLVTRPLTLGSPQNLLLDPFVGGELKGGWGHFGAGYDNGVSAAMQRTFLSASPVGGAVSIELVPAGGVPPGASSVTLAAPFLGGPGTFHADVWISAIGSTGAPVPFASVASAVSITIMAPDWTTPTPLVATAPQTFGGREWVGFVTSPDLASLPSGGWMAITLSRLDVKWMLAAPEITASSLATTSGGS